MNNKRTYARQHDSTGPWHEVDYTSVDFEAAARPYYPSVCGVFTGTDPEVDYLEKPPDDFCENCRTKTWKPRFV